MARGARGWMAAALTPAASSAPSPARQSPEVGRGEGEQSQGADLSSGSTAAMALGLLGGPQPEPHGGDGTANSSPKPPAPRSPASSSAQSWHFWGTFWVLPFGAAPRFTVFSPLLAAFHRVFFWIERAGFVSEPAVLSSSTVCRLGIAAES